MAADPDSMALRRQPLPCPSEQHPFLKVNTMQTLTPRLVRFRVPAVALAGALILGSFVFLVKGSQSAPLPSPDVTVTIPAAQEVFAPFIVEARPGTPVVWHNDDTVAHVVTTTPQHSAFLNPTLFAFTIPAHGSAALTFATPGVYDYFDSTKAHWSASDNRIEANQGVPNFPLAMEGVLWVRGPISGLARSAHNAIPGKDDYATDFLAIPAGGQVTWQNADTDTHTIEEVPGWKGDVNPASLGGAVILGTDAAPPGGGTKTQTLWTPGLYYYYCSVHATLNTQWHRAVARTTASEYPIPMEGFILVAPSS